MSAIKFRVETALVQMREDADGSALNSLEILIPMLRGAIEEVREIVMNLRPSILDDLGVVASISWFCRQFQATYAGLKVEKKLSLHEEQVPDALKTAIFRILQEAMTNAAKHSRARSVSVSLTGLNGLTELAIHDNGEGFNVQQARPGTSANGGFGLMSMRERAKLSGGSLNVESTSGKGTTVRASWER